MSKRPIRRKQANRLRHALRRTPDQYRDLVSWLVSRGHAPSRRAARELILAGKVRYESHKLGFETVETLHGPEKVLRPHVPIDRFNGRLTVVK